MNNRNRAIAPVDNIYLLELLAKHCDDNIVTLLKQ